MLVPDTDGTRTCFTPLGPHRSGGVPPGTRVPRVDHVGPRLKRRQRNSDGKGDLHDAAGIRMGTDTLCADKLTVNTYHLTTELHQISSPIDPHGGGGGQDAGGPCRPGRRWLGRDARCPRTTTNAVRGTVGGGAHGYLLSPLGHLVRGEEYERAVLCCSDKAHCTEMATSRPFRLATGVYRGGQWP